MKFNKPIINLGQLRENSKNDVVLNSQEKEVHVQK